VSFTVGCISGHILGIWLGAFVGAIEGAALGPGVRGPVEYVPFEHSSHSAAPGRDACVPAGQREHPVAEPVASRCLPATQSVQLEVAIDGAYEPVSHGVHTPSPSEA